MKVIKPGNKVPQEIQKTCKNCTAIFTYLPEDINEDYREKPFIKCPCCEKEIFV